MQITVVNSVAKIVIRNPSLIDALVFRSDSFGNALISIPDGAPDPADLSAGEVAISRDEINHKLVFTAKYSDGVTVKTFSINADA